MRYDPSNRSYQYMLLQNRAYHAQALKNQRSIIHDQMKRNPDSLLAWQKKMFEEEEKSLNLSALGHRKKSKRKTRIRTNTEEKFPEIPTGASTTKRHGTLSPHQWQQRQEEQKILRENYKLVEKLMTIKPCLPTRKAWKKEIHAQEEYKRCLSAYHQDSHRPKTTLELRLDHFQPRAIQDFLVNFGKPLQPPLQQQPSQLHAPKKRGRRRQMSKELPRLSITPMRLDGSTVGDVFPFDNDDGQATQLNLDSLTKTPHDILISEKGIAAN